ncbi:MAG: sugar ABC transporter permease [Armatimonadetes bacterium]|nr:sugar ABC transporter permease [Armatimonadota bacterium]
MRRYSRRRLADFGAAILFLLPNITGFVVFTAGPVVFSLVVSFSNWNLQQTVPFQWVGLKNYAEMFHTEDFWLYFINTGYLMLAMPVSIAGSLILAMLLSQKIRGTVIYRTLYYLPSFTSGVALLILWKALYNPEFGPVNAVIGWALHNLHLADVAQWLTGHGIEPPEWLQSTRNLLGIETEHASLSATSWGIGARDAIMFMGVWMGIGGGNMLLYLAGLSNIPQDLYDAAEVDGANRWQIFRNVTWPCLAPTTFFIIVMSFIGGLQGGFEQARVMTGGGPAGTTTTLAYYIYTRAFEQFQIGYASAISWVLFTIIFSITLVNWRLGGKQVAE